jgi:hypothetical protein
MNLRNKLLLSFLIFIAALVALGVWSALSLRELGEVSRRIIAHNYDSVVAAQDMKESLERMDSSAPPDSALKPEAQDLGWPYPSDWSKPTAGRSALDPK